MTRQRLQSWSMIFAVIVLLITSFDMYAQQTASPQGAIVINLDSNGNLQLDQQRIAPSLLIDRLHDRSKIPSDATVVIVAAASVPFKELVHAVETVREAGIERVGILKSEADGVVRESLPPVGATVLSVDRSGVVRLDGKKVKVTDVASRLRRAFQRRNDRTVYVVAYGALSFSAVDGIIDSAKSAGATGIALIASNE